jgi:ORF15|nr:MAG TPA: Protein of unknown function (DUF1642) [Caudoviricetes sp.]
MMNKDEAVQKLATVGRLSIVHAEDLYDSFFPKPVVPHCVADWYEEHKDEFYLNLHRVVRDFLEHLSAGYFNENPIDYDFACWYYNTKNAIQTLVNMHQFGYEVEKEKRYTVKIKAVLGQYLGKYYLNNEELTPQFSRTQFTVDKERPTFTRKELEDADFGWVFDCEGIEIEEVDDGND